MEITNQSKKKALLIMIVLLLFTASLFLLTYLLSLAKETTTSISPSPSPVVEDSPTIKRTLSGVALEPSFLTLEENLKNLEKDLGEVDLTESKLALPILEMSVSFTR